MPPPDSEQARWFLEEVRPHEPVLRSWLRGAFPAVRDVDDVVQESFLRVWRARAGEPIRSAKGFLFNVARHVVVDLLRRGRASPVDAVPDPAALAAPDPAADAAERACTAEEIALLAEALDALPPRCREIVLLRKFRHLSQKEVAARLGISEATVQEQVYRGLRRCERFLVARGVLRPWHHDAD